MAKAKTELVIVESPAKARTIEKYLGRDEYGRMGYFPAKENMIGKFVTLKIDGANGVSLFGTMVKAR